MRYIIITVFAVLLLATSCTTKEEAEPAVWILYFAFTDEAGSDFFATHPTYHPDSVRVSVGGQVIDFDDAKIHNNLHIFGLGPWGAGSLPQAYNHFIFGTGDIDTLRYEWEPGTSKLGSDSFSDLEAVRLFYNDSLVLTWEPNKNPAFVSELANRNAITFGASSPENPIVISFIKTQDNE